VSKYIKITNYLGSDEIVSRLALEKLGLSTKRNDAETIGQFGSGIKFAPIAALRNGWEWWFTGRDHKGPYFMQYISREEDGIDCIWYDYGDEVKPSSFTVGAGELSWTDPFQIIREAISNAMDGAKLSNSSWDFSFVDEVDYREGQFNVYITAAPELVDILNNYDKYFADGTERINSFGNYEMLKKAGDKFRVFCHNVLVSEKEVESMFDYNFDFISLNEERTVKNEYELTSSVARAIANAPAKVIPSIIKNALNVPMFEWNASTAPSYKYQNFVGDWFGIFKEMYGENAVLVKNDAYAQVVAKALKYRDRTAVFVNTDFGGSLLEAAGIPTAESIIGEEANFQIDDDIEDYSTLMTAISIATIAEPKLSDYVDQIGVLEGDAARDCRGMTININNDKPVRILISENHLQNASVSDIVATLIHEYDHASSGIFDGFSDEGKLFRNLADERIGKMIMDNYRPNPFFIQDGVVCFKASDMAMIGDGLYATTEHVRMLDCFLMKVGRFVLKLTGDAIEENFGHEHQPHFAQDATVICYPTMINVERVEVL